MTDPDLLPAVVDVALRICAHYIAAGDWDRADAWAEMSWALSEPPMDPPSCAP